MASHRARRTGHQQVGLVDVDGLSAPEWLNHFGSIYPVQSAQEQNTDTLVRQSIAHNLHEEIEIGVDPAVRD